MGFKFGMEVAPNKRKIMLNMIVITTWRHQWEIRKNC